jgi:hypothetical protein
MMLEDPSIQNGDPRNPDKCRNGKPCW